MTLVLENGYHYEELIPRNRSYQKSKRMPFTKANFKELTINIDISKLSNLEASEYKEDREMLSLNQLGYYTDSLKVPYDEFIKSKAIELYNRGGVKEMYSDSLYKKDLDPIVLANFDSVGKISVLDNALAASERTRADLENFKRAFKVKQKLLNVYNTEYHRRLAFSIACLVLFFIGAPLGSIIRKGGFGLPMILAILIFVIYYFVSTLGRNMAHSSSLTAAFGGWLATMVLLPLGLLLMKRATQDKGIFNVDLFLQPITDFFTRIVRGKNKNK